MKRLLYGGRQTPARYCLRTLWRSLVVFGAVRAGPAVYQELSASSPAPPARFR